MRTTAPAAATPRALRDRAARHYVLNGHSTSAPPLPAGLYLVATPIGNLRDITVRALEVLAAADLIACEDTRVTRKLLDHYGITTPLAAYHDHNAAEARPKLIARLAEGAAIALVSAVLAALTLSGLPTDRFLFEGFLPAKEGARRARINELKRIPGTLVLFETGARIAATLADLAAELGPRQAAICRELTKLYEEVRRGELGMLARAAAQAEEPRGEIVIVVAPPDRQAEVGAADLDALLRQALERLSVKEAVAEIAAVTGESRRGVYQRALALAKERGHGR